MLKKRFFVILIYIIFLVLFSLASFSAPAPLPANDGSLSCSNFPADNWDSCYFYPSCWMNGECPTAVEPIYSYSNIYDYECKFWPLWDREYYQKSTATCKWAYCDGATLKYNRNCGVDGICSHSATADCNSYDGIYKYPDCSLATGGGPSLESRPCAPGEQAIIDGNRYDYGCVEKSGSARCEKVGGPIPPTCTNNPSGCDSSLDCANGVSVHCKEECASDFMRDGVCAPRLQPPEFCTDNTPLNSCSSTKPKYCDANANLINNCNKCGCPSGTCQADGSCSAVPTPKCGDGNIDKSLGEVCDGSALGGETCVKQGFTSGTLKCSNDCRSFDTSSCTSGCNNNNIREANEQCDGVD